MGVSSVEHVHQCMWFRCVVEFVCVMDLQRFEYHRWYNSLRAGNSVWTLESREGGARQLRNQSFVSCMHRPTEVQNHPPAFYVCGMDSSTPSMTPINVRRVADLTCRFAEKLILD